MDKYIYDESNGLWYELRGDYYFPCLTLSAEEERPIGLWGQRHKRFLMEHCKATYYTMLTSGRLNSYLGEIDRQAEDRFFRLVEQYAAAEDVTEALKAAAPMEWVGRMNNIRSRVTEVVNAEIIYA